MAPVPVTTTMDFDESTSWRNCSMARAPRCMESWFTASRPMATCTCLDIETTRLQ